MGAIRGQLRSLAQAALIAADTIAGDNIFLPRDIPTNSSKMPNISLQTPRETRDDLTQGQGAPRFEVTTWLQLRCQVTDKEPEVVENNLEILVNQAEIAVMRLIILPPQRFKRIVQGHYEMALSAEGQQHNGEAVLEYGFVYSERFAAIPANPFGGINLTAADGPRAILLTSAGTLAGSAVLTFADPPPSNVEKGCAVTHGVKAGLIPAGAIVEAIAGNLVTMNVTATGAGIASGDPIVFSGRILATAQIDIPNS